MTIWKVNWSNNVTIWKVYWSHNAAIWSVYWSHNVTIWKVYWSHNVTIWRGFWSYYVIIWKVYWSHMTIVSSLIYCFCPTFNLHHSFIHSWWSPLARAALHQSVVDRQTTSWVLKPNQAALSPARWPLPRWMTRAGHVFNICIQISR